MSVQAGADQLQKQLGREEPGLQEEMKLIVSQQRAMEAEAAGAA